MKKQRLPPGFRYLLTTKEVKKLESELEYKFFAINQSRGIDTQKISEASITRTIHPVSLWGKKVDERWTFTIYQIGFRVELLPTPLETETKNLVIEEIKQYMNKAAKFIDTDFINRPQLWIYCVINQEKVEIKSRALK